jgi:pimeloyl-ACP methyl ester carboxylesterase
MRVVRTPEDRFSGLPDFAYPPRYADAGGLRLAYVEAGPPDGEPVLLLHGEPSWSFLYRHVLTVPSKRRPPAVRLAGHEAGRRRLALPACRCRCHSTSEYCR